MKSIMSASMPKKDYGKKPEAKVSGGYKRLAYVYDYVVSPAFRKLRRKVMDVSKAKKGDSVLEVACGTGEQAIIFAKNGIKVTGVDASKAMLKRAMNKAHKSKKDIIFLLHDASRLPFKKEEFDIVTITQALHEMHADTRVKVIKEMIRATKKRGKIVIADYAELRRNTLKGKIAKVEILLAERIAGKRHYRNYLDYMKKGAIYSLVNKCCLVIEEEQRTYDGNIAVLRMRKPG